MMLRNMRQRMLLLDRVRRKVPAVLRPVSLTRAARRPTATLPWVRPSVKVVGDSPRLNLRNCLLLACLPQGP